jgi:hypothetical protein
VNLGAAACFPRGAPQSQKAPISCLTPTIITRAGYQDLEDIEPITVVAYVETLQRRAALPTVKQHMTTKDAHLTPIVTDSRVGFLEECDMRPLPQNPVQMDLFEGDNGSTKR